MPKKAFQHSTKIRRNCHSVKTNKSVSTVMRPHNCILRFACNLCVKTSVVVVDPVKPIKLPLDPLYPTSFLVPVNHGLAVTMFLSRFISVLSIRDAFNQRPSPSFRLLLKRNSTFADSLYRHVRKQLPVLWLPKLWQFSFSVERKWKFVINIGKCKQS